MHLYSLSKRPVHLGPYPAERLGRGGQAPDLTRVKSDGILTIDDSTTGFAPSIGAFLCALDGVRQGDRNPMAAEIPARVGSAPLGFGAMTLRFLPGSR